MALAIVSSEPQEHARIRLGKVEVASDETAYFGWAFINLHYANVGKLPTEWIAKRAGFRVYEGEAPAEELDDLGAVVRNMRLDKLDIEPNRY